MQLHVGAHSAVLRGGGGHSELSARAGDWDALAAELAAQLPARARLSVTLADCWARYFLLAPPEGGASLRDGHLLLEARFEALYGQAPADWVVQADWRPAGPMLACALPRAAAQCLGAFKVAQLVPALLSLWQRHCAKLPATGALCASADGLSNLLAWRDGTMQVVRQQRGADPDALLALELARANVELPVARFWSGAAAPIGWVALEGAA
jgi:hypothetical protein